MSSLMHLYQTTKTAKSITVSVSVLKTGFVPCEFWSQWTVLLGCRSISINVSCYQTHRRWQFYLSATQCNATQHKFNCCWPPMAHSWNPKTTRFGESYSSMNTSCKSTKINKSHNKPALEWKYTILCPWFAQ